MLNNAYGNQSVVQTWSHSVMSMTLVKNVYAFIKCCGSFNIDLYLILLAYLARISGLMGARNTCLCSKHFALGCDGWDRLMLSQTITELYLSIFINTHFQAQTTRVSCTAVVRWRASRWRWTKSPRKSTSRRSPALPRSNEIEAATRAFEQLLTALMQMAKVRRTPVRNQSSTFYL